MYVPVKLVMVEYLGRNAGEGEDYEHTVLMIFGDHGQSLTGDHGGGTPEETDSILLTIHLAKWYKSKLHTPLTNKLQQFVPNTINQVDFVPSMSLLMGIPIPFGNVGKVSFEIVQPKLSLDKQLKFQQYSSILKTNTIQVQNYLQTYKEKGASGFQDLPQSPTNIHPNSTTELEQYLEEIQKFCRKQWTQFNDFYIVIGLFVVGLGVLYAGAFVYDLGYVNKFDFLVVNLMRVFHTGSMFSYNYVLYEGQAIGIMLLISYIVLIKQAICQIHKSFIIANLSAIQKNNNGEQHVEEKISKYYKQIMIVIFGGVILILCNGIMWNYGILDRSNADPFNKTQNSVKQVRGSWAEVILPVWSIPVLIFLNFNCVFDCISTIFSCFSVLLSSIWWTMIYLNNDGEQLFQQAQKLVQLNNLEYWMGSNFNQFIPRIIYTLFLLVFITNIFQREKELKTRFIENFLTLLSIIIVTSSTKGLLTIALSLLILLLIQYFKKMLNTGDILLIIIHIIQLLPYQIFFFSGHFCEFSGLQYFAGFVGFSEFEFFRSGLLLAANTFSGWILSVPIIVILFKSDQVQGILLHCVFLRGLYVLVGSISVVVLRRHLLIWALFSPKWMFEICFMVVMQFLVLVSQFLL